jgi:hypothetical protein
MRFHSYDIEKLERERKIHWWFAWFPVRIENEPTQDRRIPVRHYTTYWLEYVGRAKNLVQDPKKGWEFYWSYYHPKDMKGL